MKIKNIEKIKLNFETYHCITCDQLVLNPFGATDCKFEKGDSSMTLKEIIKYVTDDCLPF